MSASLLATPTIAPHAHTDQTHVESTVGRVPRRASSRPAAFVELSKPRIAVMVAVTVAAAAILAAGGVPSLMLLAHAVVGTVLVGASASAMNQWLERHLDQLMPRTSQRPLPTGLISSGEAIAFAAVTGVVGVLDLMAFVGWEPMAWSAATWVLYVVVYTPMKTRSWWNTVVGAVAGALPVLIGWTAVGGSTGDPRAWAMFGIVFLWQFPHFMAIAWLFRSQYENAGYRMLTVTDRSGWWSGAQSVAASLVLIPVSIAPAMGVASTVAWVYAALAIALGTMQLFLAWRYACERTDGNARRLLRGTLLYLLLLMVGLIAAPLF